MAAFMNVSLAHSLVCLENVPKYEESRGEGDDEQVASWSGLASMPGLYWGIGLGLAAITVIVDFSCLFLKRQGTFFSSQLKRTVLRDLRICSIVYLPYTMIVFKVVRHILVSVIEILRFGILRTDLHTLLFLFRRKILHCFTYSTYFQ
jgi:hypothetical protein